MTDKLIERIKTPAKWGGTCTDGSYVREMEDRILEDAKIIKAADKLAGSLSGDIVYMPHVHDKAEAYRAAVSEGRG